LKPELLELLSLILGKNNATIIMAAD